MSWIVTLLVVVQVLCAGAIIILVLLQHGKGADMGAAFGSGASGSLFGASGSANFLSRSTAVVSTVFFLATIGLAYSANVVRSARSGGLMSNVAPAAPAPALPPATAPTPPESQPGSAKPASAAPADKSAGIPK
jgi:preprotein translocase subunit SecG